MLGMWLRRIVCLACLTGSFQAAHGQAARADAAARTAAALQRTQAATEVSAQAEADLGRLELVRPKPIWLGPYVIGNAGLTYTSNPSLSKNGGRGDVYFVGGGGAGVRPNLIGGLYLDGHVKQFQVTTSMSIQAGWLSSFALDAQPSSARRNEYNFWLGWRWKIITPLEFQTYYVLSLFHYPQGSRLDVTHNVGAALTLSLARWARLSANTGFGANNSTDAIFDYTVVNVGGSLALDFRF